MKHYYVYILKCSDCSYYTGVTSDLESRLYQHENKIYPKCYTATRLPVELVFWERFYKPMHAIDFEKQIKGWRRAKKEALIEGNWHRLKELAVNYSKQKQALENKASTSSA